MSTKRNSEICSVPFCTADLSRYQCEYYHSKTKLKVCLPCSRFYWKYKRDRSEAQMSDKCSRCKVRNKNYNCSVTQQPLCRTCYDSQRNATEKTQPKIVPFSIRSQESTLDLMYTKSNSEICSVPFCTVDLSQYQCNFYHPKTMLKVCRPCSLFFNKHTRDRTEAQLSDTCSKCKVKTKRQYCSITQLPLCKSCYDSQRSAIKKAQPKTVPFWKRSMTVSRQHFEPDTNPPVLIDEPSKNHEKLGSGSQESSLDPMNPFLTDVSRIFPTIDSIENAFDHSDFTDHSFSSPDGNGASDLVMEDETKTPEDAFDHSDFYVHSSHDHVSGSNKNRYTAIGNQEENYDIIATDVSNCFTNANLLPEIEISDHRLKSNSEICSVPFCTVDLSQYQRKFYHPETEVRVCRPCCRFFNKHKRDRTEAQMSDKCSKCKIKKKTIHCSITQQPLCKSRFAAPQLVSDVCEAPIQRPRNTLFKKEKPIRRMRQIHDDEDIDSD